MAAVKILVLVAEDDPVIGMALVETLEDAGYDVLEAQHGRDAIALIDDPDHVEQIVTNLNMPGHDGVEVASKAGGAPASKASRLSSAASVGLSASHQPARPQRPTT
jgi:CheY-like chemotaxis protein